LSASKKPNCAIIALAEPSRQLRDSHTSVSGAIIQGALENDGATFVNHKDGVSDPVVGTDREKHVSSSWDLPYSGWPLAQTFGLTGTHAINVMYGGASPRSSGGFTIYRPWHWSLANTDLYYGDLVGGRPDCIVAYEVDGCDFTMRDGLPYPTGKMARHRILAS
jgi:hypothetical protein